MPLTPEQSWLVILILGPTPGYETYSGPVISFQVRAPNRLAASLIAQARNRGYWVYDVVDLTAEVDPTFIAPHTRTVRHFLATARLETALDAIANMPEPIDNETPGQYAGRLRNWVAQVRKAAS